MRYVLVAFPLVSLSTTSAPSLFFPLHSSSIDILDKNMLLVFLEAFVAKFLDVNDPEILANLKDALVDIDFY